MKAMPGDKCGMRTTLAMTLLTVLTTSLLVKWAVLRFLNQSFFGHYKTGEKIKYQLGIFGNISFLILLRLNDSLSWVYNCSGGASFG
ncbi:MULTISPECIES: hypothetical protein [unclassified Escherichia]|uniref:hypothetical protein n=1 Tax=unclassified Escherichia TaxID=2608889 RepID=UPI0012FFFE74|nr:MULTISPECIES: hypothetical protein [unclassified Escherichia]MBB2405878.1 hypothetical protein [Escherichia sp. 14.0982]HDK2737742.1 hypothetical protein [Escherichia coli]